MGAAAGQAAAAAGQATAADGGENLPTYVVANPNYNNQNNVLVVLVVKLALCESKFRSVDPNLDIVPVQIGYVTGKVAPVFRNHEGRNCEYLGTS